MIKLIHLVDKNILLVLTDQEGEHVFRNLMLKLFKFKKMTVQPLTSPEMSLKSDHINSSRSSSSQYRDLFEL